MREAIASAPGKINLSLRVGPRQADGYHPLVTVFEAVSLREYVQARTRRAPGIGIRDIVCNPEGGIDRQQSALMRELPPQKHLAYRAAEALRPLAAAHGWGATSAGVSLTVYKTLPVAGGMAGGSADAAATLVALNEMWSLGLTIDNLCQVGARLGADVPACLRGGLSVGTNRGDKVEPLQRQRHDWWALAFSDQGLPTPDVFAYFDGLNSGSDAEARFLESGADLEADLDADIAGLVNDLAPAALALRPDLSQVGEAALEAGATEWTVSGSGPTVACRCVDEASARRVGKKLTELPSVRDTAVVSGPAPGAQLESGLPVQLMRISAGR